MKCCAGDLSNAAAEVRTVTCSAAELRNLDIKLLRVCFDKGIRIHQKADAAHRKNWCCRRPRTIKLDFSQTKLCFNRIAVVCRDRTELFGGLGATAGTENEGIRSSRCGAGERGRRSNLRGARRGESRGHRESAALLHRTRGHPP